MQIQQDKLVWIKAGKCESANSCVEMAALPDGGVAVRDSKQNGTGPVLAYTQSEWDAFLDGAKKGEFDGFLKG